MKDPVDQFITHFDGFLRTVSGSIGVTARRSPAENVEEADLTDEQRQHAARLMRINHCGEVCAQALYQGQALTARSSRVAGALEGAAREETDHLSWCEKRITELDSHVSYLNPLYYSASFAMGVVTGLLGDKVNLGFVAATEEEVCRHLDSHLARLPDEDLKSKRILSQMRDDEQRHANTALDAGGARFPGAVKRLMHGMSNLMKRTTYWI